MQDSGRYSCEATNVAGKTEKNYNLNVWGESNFFFAHFPFCFFVDKNVFDSCKVE